MSARGSAAVVLAPVSLFAGAGLVLKTSNKSLAMVGYWAGTSVLAASLVGGCPKSNRSFYCYYYAAAEPESAFAAPKSKVFD